METDPVDPAAAAAAAAASAAAVAAADGTEQENRQQIHELKVKLGQAEAAMLFAAFETEFGTLMSSGEGLHGG